MAHHGIARVGLPCIQGRAVLAAGLVAALASVLPVGAQGVWEPVVGDRAVIAVEPLIVMDEKEMHVRIEDTVLITDDGAEVLSVGLPKEVDELLGLVGSTSVQGDASP